MADNSRIEWTDATWNPTTGCTKVSPGCDHCYAETLFNRFHGPGAFDTVTLRPERLDQPLRWRKPRRVFVNSMSDLFHDNVPDGYIAWVFYVMEQCPQHTFQVLTKRHARMRSFMKRWTDRTGDRDADKPSGMPPMPRGPQAIRETYTSGRALLFADMLEQWGEPPDGAAYPLYDWMEGPRFWPAPAFNIWLGVSVENQQWADTRIPALLDTPAAVRFLSCEPLLGPVDLASSGYLSPDEFARGIGWVIVGAESGRGARPMNEQWARTIKDQCQATDTAFFLKQYAVNGRKVHLPELDGRVWDEFPESAVVA